MEESFSSIVKLRQDPLRARYREVAGEASIIDRAQTVNVDGEDPFHGSVVAGEGDGQPWRVGIHRAVGGYHDLPNPGDVLCAALASCLDTTTRMIADRLGIRIASLQVAVHAEADARGALLVDRSIPVGFQRIECRVRLRASGDPASIRALVAAAEHSCVVLQTLRGGATIQTHLETPAEASA